MRLRNVPGARETIIENQFSVQQPEQMKGKWAEVFQNDHPIHIEVGMGKGQFIIEMARRNPEVNYIGIEKYSSVLVRAVEKLEDFEQDNLRLIRMDAENIEEVFDKDEVDRIYLNFSLHDGLSATDLRNSGKSDLPHPFQIHSQYSLHPFE